MPGILFNLPKAVPLSGGAIVPGGKLTFSQTGTSTPQNTYTDLALTTAHDNPVEADAAGVFPPIYLDGSLPSYRVRLTDADDTLIYQVDDVPSAQKTVSDEFTITGTSPYLLIAETDGSANNKNWRWIATSEQLILQLGNDALDTWTDMIRLNRASTTPQAIDLVGTTLKLNGADVSSVIKYKTADTSRTSNTNVADDAHLAGWSLIANAFYSIEGVLLVSDPGSANLDMALQFTSTPQESKWGFHFVDTGQAVYSSYSNDATAEHRINPASTVAGAAHLYGYFQANAVSGGGLDFQWAQGSSSGTATVLQKGSWIGIRKIST